jgi:sodium transport system permease protein
VVLGLLAVRSRSLLPGILFHLLNNAVAITQASRLPYLESAGVASWLYRTPAEGLYHGIWIASSGLVSALLFLYLWKVDRQLRSVSDRELQPAF